MKNFITAIFVVLLAISQIQAQKTIIHAGTLINGVDSEPMKEVSLIIENQRISEIRSGYINGEEDDEVINLREHTVMPGFIDLHVHLESETNPQRYLEAFTFNDADIALRASSYARKTLMAGFTTVRDLGGTGVNTSLRNAVNSGFVVGPRIFSVGKSLATTGGHADPTNGWKEDLMGSPGPEQGVLNGVAEAREAVRQRYKNGADHIKITATGGVLSVAKSGDAPQFFEDELDAIIATASEYGMHVAAHAHGAEGMLRAVEAGVLTIEHGTKMTTEVMDRMIEKGTYYVPTISAGKWVAEKAEVDGYYPAIVVPKALEIGPMIQETFSKAYKRGVNIAFGTDAGVFPHGMNAKEFAYMTEAGMSAMEAIQSATLTAATVLNMQEEIGSLEQGKLADIVAVKGNPLDDISILEQISFVMKEGIRYN